MIKSIELKNIQSHENTKLEFSPGINAIIGSSNNGKSAILRGLYWVKYNRPLGIDTYCSHWNMTEKGTMKGEMSVTVENDSSIITRRRTKDQNQYIVDGEVLNVVKTDVPDEVEQSLHLSDTNIQKQLDSPFLLSESSGKVAEYFNKIVRLDIIDKVLSNAESQRRKTKQEVERTEKQIEILENKLSSFDWMNGVDKLIHKVEVLSEMETEINAQKSALEESINNYKSYKTYDFSKQNSIIAKINILNEDIKDTEFDINSLECQISIHKNHKTYDFSKQKKLIDEISIIEIDDSEIEKLQEQIKKYKWETYQIESSQKDIECLKDQLPDVCPYCGNIIKNCGGK